MPEPILPQVKNIVFLMLENRSLDNVLGWLYEQDNPQNVYPPNSSKAYDGLQTGDFSNPAYTWDGAVKNYFVVKRPGDLGQDSDQVPGYDPYEPLKEKDSWNGTMNQLFGNQDIIKKLPAKPTVAGMKGFLQDYYAGYMATWKGLDILWTYTREDLPVINGLARSYAVSDRWFCSVPSNTNPNRAYSICGTSLGRDSYREADLFENFNVPTVFNLLADAGKKSLGLYYTDASWLFSGTCYTEFTFPYVTRIPRFTGPTSSKVPDRQIEKGDIATFFQRAQAGNLPDFTYLEPKWGYSIKGIKFQGTDYHPPTHLNPGEDFLKQVYEAVRNGKQWQKTLLIVTFDEHGGTYDHVAPPWSATNPDGMNNRESGFLFDLFGVRVPTILISPFVRPSTVFRAPPVGPSNPTGLPFDHTSFIKTLLMWAGVDPEKAGLGKRVPIAPTFDYIFASELVDKEEAPLQSPPESKQAPSAPSGEALNPLFEGVPFGVTKAIMTANADVSLSQMRAEIERYREDPEKFLTLLKASLSNGEHSTG